MAIKDILILGFIVCLFSGRSEAVTTQYTCTMVTDTSMQMEMKSNEFVQLAGFDTDQLELTSCASSEELIDGEAYQVLRIVTDASRTQTSPDPTTSDCKVDALASPDDTKVVYNIALLSEAGFVKVTDKYGVATCDSETADANSITTLDSVAITTIGIPSETKDENVDGFLLQVRSGVDDTVITAGDLGDQIYLQFIYTRTLDEKAISAGAHMYNLEVSGTSDFAISYPILDEHGCPLVTDSDGAFYMATGFIDDDTNSDGDDTTFVTNSVEFPIVAMIGSAELNFKGQFELCPGTTEPMCYDIVAYCASQRRKKRSAQDAASSGNVTASIRLRFESGSSANQEGTNDGVKGKENEEPFCRETYKFWIVAIVLGALLLLAMLFAIYLYFRLRREQRQSEKLMDRFGTPNPSVQS